MPNLKLFEKLYTNVKTTFGNNNLNCEYEVSYVSVQKSWMKNKNTEHLPMVFAYVSAIQDISLSPVPISGAGTSTPGPGMLK